MASTAELNKLQPLLVQLLLEKEILTPEQIEVLNEARAKDHGSAGEHPGEEGAGHGPAHRRGVRGLPDAAAVRHGPRARPTRSWPACCPKSSAAST